MLFPWLAVLALTGAPQTGETTRAQDPSAETPQTAPEAKPAPNVDDVVRTGIALLLQNQERYRTDRGIGRLPDDQLEAWQAKEQERLEKERNRKSKRPKVEWPYEGVYRVAPLGAIPSGYRVGGTSIVCLALLHAPGYDQGKDRQAAVARSVDFVLNRFDSDPTLEGQEQGSYDVRGWGQAYGLELYLTVLERKAVDEALLERCHAAIPDLIDRLAAGEVNRGGWNYAGRACSPFMTGATLLTLFRAAKAGYDVPQDLVERALDALEAARNEESGSFAYSGRRRSVMPASAGRSAIAELALLQAGRSDAERLRNAVDGFFTNWDHLFDRKSQQGTHEPPYNIAPYYFFFAHTYAAYAIEALPAKLQPEYRQQLQSLLWRTQQDNGGWNDRIFPRTESYSTAMSLLAIMAPQMPAQATWTPVDGSQDPKKNEDAAKEGKSQIEW